MLNKNIIEMENITKRYKTMHLATGTSNEQCVLNGINLNLEQGDYISIMGKSGSGKSTILNIMAMLISPSDGEIRWKTKDVKMLNDAEISDIRRNETGFIYQDFQLIKSLSLIDNIMLPVLLNKQSSDIANQKAKKLADMLGLGQIIQDKRPGEVSGGERQRAAIARALINDPELILADEPTGNLDEQSSREVFRILQELHKNMGKTIVMVTHNPVMALGSDRVYYLENGILQSPIINQGNSDLYYKEILNKISL